MQLVDDFKNAIGRPVTHSTEYHGADRRPGHYAIEPDGSLEPYRGDAGVEFISPALPLDEMLSDLAEIKSWARRRGCYTGKAFKTGLHINVSTPNYDREKLDYVKLVLMMGDEHILKEFERQAVHYCASGLKNVQALVRRRPEAVDELLDAMKQGLNRIATQNLHSTFTDKYTSANVKQTHIEFRSPGGDWLSDNIFSKIEPTISRFVVALDTAMDPTKDRQEYLKKLHKLLTQTEVEKKVDPVTGRTEVVPKGRGYTKTGHEYVVAKYLAGELTREQLLVALGKETPRGGEWEDGNYEIIDTKRHIPIFRLIANTDNEAEAKFKKWLSDNGYPENNNLVSLRRVPGRHYGDDVKTSPGGENLPPGNRRWAIQDNDGRVLHSFIFRDDHDQAQQ